MPTDDLGRLRKEIRDRREGRQFSREHLANLAGLRLPNGSDPIDWQFVRYLETRCRRLPPREKLEPVALSLGLTWRDCLELVG